MQCLLWVCENILWIVSLILLLIPWATSVHYSSLSSVTVITYQGEIDWCRQSSWFIIGLTNESFCSQLMMLRTKMGQIKWRNFLLIDRNPFALISRYQWMFMKTYKNFRTEMILGVKICFWDIVWAQQSHFSWTLQKGVGSVSEHIYKQTDKISFAMYNNQYSFSNAMEKMVC